MQLVVRASAVLGPREVNVPTSGWNDTGAAILSTWVHIAAEAQEAHSAATALRLYYLLFEDPRFVTASLEGASAHFLMRLKALRDFVSHPKIDSASTRATLLEFASQLADDAGELRFRPSCPLQRAVLERWRQKARAIVDRQLHHRLGLGAAPGGIAG